MLIVSLDSAHNQCDIFEDPEQSQVKLVLNPDQLASAEAIRILKELKDINIHLYQVINNKMQHNSVSVDINRTFADIPMLNFPRSETPLIGLKTLEYFLAMNGDVVEEQLSVC